MKKITGFLCFLLFLIGLSSSQAQTNNYNVQPIPSFNFAMNEPVANFFELKSPGVNREKRDMEVVVNTRSTSSFPFFATVYVFKVVPNKVLGPFYVYAGQQLTVPIDNSRWGVRVLCDRPADVSVWID